MKQKVAVVHCRAAIGGRCTFCSPNNFWKRGPQQRRRGRIPNRRLRRSASSWFTERREHRFQGFVFTETSADTFPRPANGWTARARHIARSHFRIKLFGCKNQPSFVSLCKEQNQRQVSLCCRRPSRKASQATNEAAGRGKKGTTHREGFREQPVQRGERREDQGGWRERGRTCMLAQKRGGDQWPPGLDGSRGRFLRQGPYPLGREPAKSMPEGSLCLAFISGASCFGHSMGIPRDACSRHHY